MQPSTKEFRHESNRESGDDHWRDVYLAALFENDKAHIPRKIAEAQRVIAMRRSELLKVPGSDVGERQALDKALFSLQALRTCVVTTRLG
jgi:hypothetical protein